MMEKINILIKQLAEKLGIMTDKVLHCIVSLIIAFVFGLIFNGSVISMILTMLIGVGKEIFDTKKENPTGFDVNDLAFDSLGCILGYFISLPIALLF
jgi:predicted membrane chloride channel (bestrophin family)